MHITPAKVAKTVLSILAVTQNPNAPDSHRAKGPGIGDQRSLQSGVNLTKVRGDTKSASTAFSSQGRQQARFLIQAENKGFNCTGILDSLPENVTRGVVCLDEVDPLYADFRGQSNSGNVADRVVNKLVEGNNNNCTSEVEAYAASVANVSSCPLERRELVSGLIGAIPFNKTVAYTTTNLPDGACVKIGDSYKAVKDCIDEAEPNTATPTTAAPTTKPSAAPASAAPASAAPASTAPASAAPASATTTPTIPPTNEANTTTPAPLAPPTPTILPTNIDANTTNTTIPANETLAPDNPTSLAPTPSTDSDIIVEQSSDASELGQTGALAAFVGLMAVNRVLN